MRELQNSLPSDNTAQPIISVILKVTEYVLYSNEGKFTVVLFVGIHWMIIIVGIILFLFNQVVIDKYTILYYVPYYSSQDIQTCGTT